MPIRILSVAPALTVRPATMPIAPAKPAAPSDRVKVGTDTDDMASHCRTCCVTGLPVCIICPPTVHVTVSLLVSFTLRYSDDIGPLPIRYVPLVPLVPIGTYQSCRSLGKCVVWSCECQSNSTVKRGRVEPTPAITFSHSS